MPIKDIISYSWSGIALFVIIYFLMNPTKFEKWVNLFNRLFLTLSRNFPKFRERMDRRTVASDIQYSVNRICDKINEDCPGILPYALKIEWTKSISPESFIRDGKAIIRLKRYANQDKNIVDSTLAYLRHGFMPRARAILDSNLRQSCLYKVAGQVFISMKDTSAYPYFIEERLNRQITEDIKNDIQLLEDLDSVGFFTRVFLAEVHLTGEKLLGSIPNDAHKKEIRDFANFLRVISRKGREERVPLDFVGAKISVRVILIAKRFKLQDYGIDPYLTAIKWGIRNGRDSIYISGWGNEFVSAIKEIKKAVGGRILNVLRAYEYSIGGMTKGILLVCQPKSSYWAVIREAQSEVSEALREIVPEIAAGKIKIISVVRKRGVGFKVSVASTDPAIENAGMCINAQPAYIKRLKEKFPGEFAGFINWTDNIPQFIKNALRPLPLKSILELELDEENSVAFVKVQGEAAIRRAIGKSYSNLSLASELTGWYIKVTKVDEDEISAELKEIIAQDIEEVRCGEIEIIKLARMKGFGARVLVRWANKARAGTASRVCIGDRLCNLNKIRERIENEVIYFHDWYDKPEDLISECLYPLGKELIRSIEIHEDMGIAFITIRNAEGDRWALNKDNLELVEKITGYQLEIWDEKNPTTI